MKCGHALTRSTFINSRAPLPVPRPLFQRRYVQNPPRGPDVSGKTKIEQSGSGARHVSAGCADVSKSNGSEQPDHDEGGSLQNQAVASMQQVIAPSDLSEDDSHGDQTAPKPSQASEQTPAAAPEPLSSLDQSADEYTATVHTSQQQSTGIPDSLSDALQQSGPADAPATAQPGDNTVQEQSHPSLAATQSDADLQQQEQGEIEMPAQTAPQPLDSIYASEDSSDAESMDQDTNGDAPAQDTDALISSGFPEDGDQGNDDLSADERTESDDEASLELQGTKISAAPDLMTSRQMPTVPSDSEPGDELDELSSSAASTAGDSGGTEEGSTPGLLSAGVLLPGFPRLLPAPPLLPEPRPRTSKPLKQLLPLKPGLVARAVKLQDGTLFSFTPTVSAPSGTPVDMVEDPITEPGPDAMLPPRPPPPAASEAAAAEAVFATEAATADLAPAADDAGTAEAPIDSPAAPDGQQVLADPVVPAPEQPMGDAALVDTAAETMPVDRDVPEPAVQSTAGPVEVAPPEPPMTDAASPELTGVEEAVQVPRSEGPVTDAPAGGPAGAEAGTLAGDVAPVEAAPVEEYFTDVETSDDGAGATADAPADTGAGAVADVGAAADVGSLADPGEAAVPQDAPEGQGVMAPEAGPSGDDQAGARPLEGAPRAEEAAGAALPGVVASDGGAAAVEGPAAGAAGAPGGGVSMSAQADGRAAAAQFMQTRGDVVGEPGTGAVWGRAPSAGDGAAAGGAIVTYRDPPAADGAPADAGNASVAMVPGGAVRAADAGATDVPPLPDGVRDDRPTDVSTAMAARAVSNAMVGQSLLPRGRGAKPQVPPRLADAAEAAAASAAETYANAKPRTDSPFVTSGSMDDADGGPRREPPPETIIHPFHLTLFAILLVGGVAFAITVINFTTDMGWVWSSVRVLRKLAKSLAFRQTIALLVAIAFVRYGLEPLVRSVRSVFALPGQWERSNEYFILKQVYQPLEFLLFVAAISTVVEAVLPPLVAVQKDTVRTVVRTMLSLTYVIASAFVVFNVKARIVQERCWQAEIMGDTAAQRSIEATDKLLTVLFLFVATLLGLQAIGLDIQSVLAISGFGGLALGLAGREILENLFNGLLIVSSRSFEVGEEIMFTQAGHAGRIIEGIIMDIGWYRTLIRSFEREVYIVPNSVFSRTVVLNVTRKGKEWRVFENIGVRVEDIAAIPDIVNHMRRIIREDSRVLPKLHRRVFLDKIQRDQLTVYISFYIEAANRDAFMATKQEIFMQFATACARHGAKLAQNRHQVELMPGSLANGANGGSYPVMSFPQGFPKGLGADPAPRREPEDPSSADESASSGDDWGNGGGPLARQGPGPPGQGGSRAEPDDAR